MLEAYEQSVSPSMREAGGVITTREIVLWAGAPDKSVAGRSDSPWGPEGLPSFGVFLVIGAGLILLAAALRGGVSMMLAGIVIVRADGRRAYRSQCALRAALVWLPIIGLLFAATLIQIYTPRQVYLAAGLFLAAVALLPVYTVIALRFPARPPQDRLVGTYLVPM
jgi:hypothetical protein